MTARDWRRAGSGSGTRSSGYWGVDEATVRARRLRAGVAITLQDRRHLRRRVRAPTRRTTTPPTRTTTEVRPATGQGDDPRVGSEPHRTGHRVRLLLRPRQLRPGGRRIRDHHGELQSGDGLDGLRHLRPPVLRTAHLRGCAERDRGGAGDRPRRGEPGWSASSSRSAGRPRSSCPTGCPPSSCSAPARHRSTWPRTVSTGAASAPASRSRSPRVERPPPSRRPSLTWGASATRS